MWLLKLKVNTRYTCLTERVTIFKSFVINSLIYLKCVCIHSTNIHTHFLYSEHTIYRFVVVTTLHTNSAKVAFELFLCLDSRVLFCFGYLTHKILVMPVLKVKVIGIPL